MQPNESEPIPPTASSAPPPVPTPAEGSAPAEMSTPPVTRGGRIMRWVVGIVMLVLVIAIVRGTTRRELSVDSEPAGASVFIDGRLVGKTPIRVSGLEAGTYSLRFEREDFSPLTVPVIVGIGTTRLNQKLPPRGDGSLKVAVEPAGAEVLLDGELVGHTPLDLLGVPVGSHDLVIRKTNFKTYSTRFITEAGKEQQFKDFVLEDVILAMLQNAIDKDPQRVANYMDMGRYMFKNNRLREAGDYYVRGLQ